MQFLKFAVNNIRKGKIPRLSTVQQRPQGTVSIGVGRRRNDDDTGTIAPEEIPARTSDEGEFNEMVEEITELLRRKEPAYGVPLVRFIPGNHRRAEHPAAAGAVRRPGDQAGETDHRPGHSRLRPGDQKLQPPELAGQVQGLQGEPANPRTQGGEGSQGRGCRKRNGTSPAFCRSWSGSVVRRAVPIWGGIGGGGWSIRPGIRRRGFAIGWKRCWMRWSKEGVLRATRTSKGAFVYAPGPNAGAYQQNVAG